MKDPIELEMFLEFLELADAPIDEIVDAEMDLLIAQQGVEEIDKVIEEEIAEIISSQAAEDLIYEEEDIQNEWTDFADEYGDDHWLFGIDAIEELHDFDEEDDPYATPES